MARKIPKELEQRLERASTVSKDQLAEHSRLAAELTAIQEDLERRVSLGKQPRGSPPWKSDKRSS